MASELLVMRDGDTKGNHPARVRCFAGQSLSALPVVTSVLTLGNETNVLGPAVERVPGDMIPNQSRRTMRKQEAVQGGLLTPKTLSPDLGNDAGIARTRTHFLNTHRNHAETVNLGARKTDDARTKPRMVDVELHMIAAVLDRRAMQHTKHSGSIPTGSVR